MRNLHALDGAASGVARSKSINNLASETAAGNATETDTKTPPAGAQLPGSPSAAAPQRPAPSAAAATHHSRPVQSSASLAGPAIAPTSTRICSGPQSLLIPQRAWVTAAAKLPLHSNVWAVTCLQLHVGTLLICCGSSHLQHCWSSTPCYKTNDPEQVQGLVHGTLLICRKSCSVLLSGRLAAAGEPETPEKQSRLAGVAPSSPCASAALRTRLSSGASSSWYLCSRVVARHTCNAHI